MRRSLLLTAQRSQLSTISTCSTQRFLSSSILASSRTGTAQRIRPRILPVVQVLAPRIGDVQSPSYRFYSSEQTSSSATNGETAAKDATEKDSVSPSEQEKQQAEDPVKKELDAAKKEVVDLKDKYLRSVADFRNLQERTKRELGTARDFAISKFARDLLDSVDNLDRALLTVPESVIKPSETKEGGEVQEVNKDLQNLYDGLKMTETVLLSTLARHGLERFDPAEKGDKFDPNIHDASFMAPMPDKVDGSVFTTIQKGFRLNGRVIRAAKVGVVKNS